MDFGPASELHARLCLALKTAGMALPMSYLLLGVIINTIALININPASFVLGARTVADILSLEQEIALLCIYYNIEVVLEFESLKLVPDRLRRDCKALGINRKVLIKKNRLSEKDIQTRNESHTLLCFLALVRYLMAHSETQTELLISDFNRTSLVYLPFDTIRKPGVGQRLVRRRPVSSVWTLNGQGFEICTPAPAPMREVLNTKAQPIGKPRFNPFKSKPRPTRPASTRMHIDDDDENFPPQILAEAPLRMRRKPFGLRRF
ncbi:unnamed protein product [Rhizoctonia solani]|uniref:Uncharacterized protein n=1 Tax=Rhizoctonia solani TaxID=456999 RepID=A0A8H3HKP0_9AGAM|nr:unnamed protein product [Rhizoctonia solani]CAE6530225.1 unnamed protein product [Rhizoctonia solani]